MLFDDAKVELLKVPFRETWDDEDAVCVCFKTTRDSGDVTYTTFTVGGKLTDMQPIFKSDLKDHDVVGNAGDFVILQSFDMKEIRILDFFSRMIHPLRIEIKE